jgi:hypothetical protein
MNKENSNQIGKSKVTILDKKYDWGVYVWIKANGKPFTDGNNSVLNIPSHRGDEIQLEKLRQAAAHYGQADGHPEFYPGVARVSEEEYSEQLDRMKNGLIPNLNDLGAVAAAKATIAKYGDEE